MNIHRFATGPRFRAHTMHPDFNTAMKNAYDYTHNGVYNEADQSMKVGFYQEGFTNPTFHVVTNADLEQAVQRRQPHLFIGWSWNRLGESLQKIYKNT